MSPTSLSDKRGDRLSDLLLLRSASPTTLESQDEPSTRMRL